MFFIFSIAFKSGQAQSGLLTNQALDSIPNIFSPNNDGINDYIDFSNLNLAEEIIDIYDRWGIKVFVSSATNTKWDGKNMKGADCAEGVYYCLFHYSDFINKKINKKGFIQLLR